MSDEKRPPRTPPKDRHLDRNLFLTPLDPEAERRLREIEDKFGQQFVLVDESINEVKGNTISTTTNIANVTPSDVSTNLFPALVQTGDPTLRGTFWVPTAGTVGGSNRTYRYADGWTATPGFLPPCSFTGFEISPRSYSVASRLSVQLWTYDEATNLPGSVVASATCAGNAVNPALADLGAATGWSGGLCFLVVGWGTTNGGAYYDIGGYTGSTPLMPRPGLSYTYPSAAGITTINGSTGFTPTVALVLT